MQLKLLFQKNFYPSMVKTYASRYPPSPNLTKQMYCDKIYKYTCVLLNVYLTSIISHFSCAKHCWYDVTTQFFVICCTFTVVPNSNIYLLQNFIFSLFIEFLLIFGRRLLLIHCGKGHLLRMDNCIFSLVTRK